MSRILHAKVTIVLFATIISSDSTFPSIAFESLFVEETIFETDSVVFFIFLDIIASMTSKQLVEFKSFATKKGTALLLIKIGDDYLRGPMG